MRFPLVIVSLVLLTVPARALAQPTRTPVAHSQTVSTNPFALMLNWLNVEYERKLSNSVTIGASASRLDADDEPMRRGTLFARFYPQGAALTGTYFGLRAGIVRASDERLFATGMELGYTWLLGSKRNLGISIGAGVDRVFGDTNEFDDIRALPTIRLINVGIAF